jgi:hypothetical protein
MMLVDLIKSMIVYSPVKRITALDALSNRYFDDLRDESFGKE